MRIDGLAEGVDDEDRAARVPQHRPGDITAQQPVESGLGARADDDELGIGEPGHLHDASRR
jgi:hypothetical protein